MKAHDVEQQLAQVVASYNAGRRDEAQRLCRQCLLKAPKHPGVNHLYAVICLEAGDAQQALAHAQTSLASQPTHAGALGTALRAARAAGSTALALQYAQRAADLTPESVDLRCQHAAMLTDAGQPQAARAQLEGAARGHVGHPGVWYELGRACRALGDLPAARSALEAATQLDATLVPGWFALSLVLQDLNETVLACTALERVLTLAPDHVEAAINLGLVHQALGKLEAALASYAWAYARAPETLGRIAHALCSQACGAMWTTTAALEQALRDAAGGAAKG